MAELDALVGNPGDIPRADLDWCAIIGANPSAGARSPVLWNAAFDALGSTTRMVPLDVTDEHLDDVLALLDADPHFLGGAVAVPHKSRAAAWLGDRVTAGARRAGAVNALHRADDGNLRGANTDGEAALLCLRDTVEVAGADVVVLGAGGVAAAVVASITAEEPTARVQVVARRPERAAALGAVPWSMLDAMLETAGVLVNCTSLGSAAAGTSGETPLDAGQVALLPENAVVYDVIYDPSPTRLLELASARGLRVLDGGRMNLEQAVLAFQRIDPREPVFTRAAMEQVWLDLQRGA